MTERIRRLIAANSFQNFIIGVIILAGVIAGLETSRTTMERHGPLLLALDKVILAVFIGEAALKIAAHGRRPWRYFADCWNVFDFLILTVCLLPVGGPFAAVLRLARALRLLRLVSALPKLQLLVGALMKSLSAMGYVGILLALLFYIYAVAGVHLFGATDPVHFGSIGTTLLTLFRIVTLDNWGDILTAQFASVPVVKAVAFFASFIILGTMIMLNLFIGIIMNSMSEMHDEIAAREAAQHPAGQREPALGDELELLERDISVVRARIAALRRQHREQEPQNIREIDGEKAAA